MQIFILKRALLLLTMLIVIMLIGCGASGAADSPDTGKDPEGDARTDNAPTLPPALEGIPTPESYGRDSIHFSQIEYKRPDADATVSTILNAAEHISRSEMSFEAQAEQLSLAKDAYSDFCTMYTYASIKVDINSDNSFYRDELSYFIGALANVKAAVRELCARVKSSPHASLFEDRFADGEAVINTSTAAFTDKLAELLKKEDELVISYSTLSPDTVVINYGDREMTYSDALASLDLDSKSYKADKEACDKLYKTRLAAITKSTVIELFKVRREISDALGYESYTDFAYENLGYTYCAEDMAKFAENVKKYVIPVYEKLDEKVFYNYFTKTQAMSASPDTVYNTLCGLYRGVDRELAGIVGYMHSYELYNIGHDSERESNAYTAYISSPSLPYIFMNANGTVEDYSILAYEIGHFTNLFVNGSGRVPSDVSELSASAIEYLTLSKLEGVLPDAEYRYLYYSSMKDALLTLINQSLCSSFEHMAYSLKYDEITDERLSSLVSEAAKSLGLAPGYYNDVEMLPLDNIIKNPHFSQTYATSVAAALEMLFLEQHSDGEGIAAYKSIISADKSLGVIERMKAAKLTCPFDQSALKCLADKIYYSVLGSHYYTEFNQGGEEDSQKTPVASLFGSGDGHFAYESKRNGYHITTLA